MTPKTKFVVGALAISKTHMRPVTILSRKGKNMTVAGFPSNKPLPGMVKDEDLLTPKEFEVWAPKQPGYTPPPPINSLEDALDLVQEIAARVARCTDVRPDKISTSTSRPRTTSKVA